MPPWIAYQFTDQLYLIFSWTFRAGRVKIEGLIEVVNISYSSALVCRWCRAAFIAPAVYHDYDFSLFLSNRELAGLPQRGWRQIPEAPLVGGHGCTGETNHQISAFHLVFFTRAESVSVNQAFKMYFKPQIFKKRTTAWGKHVFLSQIWHPLLLFFRFYAWQRAWWERCKKLKIIYLSSRGEMLSNVLFVDRWRHGFHREDELHPQGSARRQHSRGRQPRVQDRRLWSSQVDRGQWVHGEARWAHTHTHTHMYGVCESQVN